MIINASFEDLEAFYDTIVLPPPYRSPRGKATAERYVKVIQRKIIAVLEKQFVFKDLDEVNECVMKTVEEVNIQKPKGYNFTHNEMFELYDKPAMKPLKDTGFVSCEYVPCHASDNSYHVYFDSHFYSVPYRKAASAAILKATVDKIFVCDRNNHLIAEHKRCYIPTLRNITKPEHMPANHRFYEEVNTQSGADYLKWADETGSYMRILIHDILKSAKHEEQMYRTCNSIVQMCKGVPKGVCEEAAADCVKRKQCRYSEFRKVLSDLLTQRRQSSKTAVLPEVDDVWGKEYYK